MVRGAVHVRDTEARVFRVEAALGLGRGRKPPGEGVAERVAESGKSVVVPQASLEPSVPSPIKKGRGPVGDVTIISVPVSVDRKPVGALTVELPFKRDRDYDRSTKFMGVVASLVAQAIKLNRLVEAERSRLIQENRLLREELRGKYDFSNIVGNSGPMRQVYEQVAQVARTNTTVLIRGESGTGKELIAQAIHYNSLRAKKPFVKVNCAALPETLIETELFGYEKGAFTGAQDREEGPIRARRRAARCSSTRSATSASATQVKLLRVLQEREFERLGGTETIKVERPADRGDEQRPRARRSPRARFREDLYYRLNVFTDLRPAAARAEVRHPPTGAITFSRSSRSSTASTSGASRRRPSTCWSRYHWPGNVRELENMHRARGPRVRRRRRARRITYRPRSRPPSRPARWSECRSTEAVEAYEKDISMDALKTTRGNCAKAARLLSTTERILAYKVKKFGVDPRRFRG